jgi:hypothetical protein
MPGDGSQLSSSKADCFGTKKPVLSVRYRLYVSAMARTFRGGRCTRHCTLGALLTAPGCGRAWTRQILREWDLDHLTDSTELLVSELTTNALEGGRRSGDIAGGCRQDCSNRSRILCDIASASL